MTSFEIIKKRHDENKVVTHVKLREKDDLVRKVEQIIKWLNNEKYSFYTMYENIQADVRVGKHPETGREFLISTADGIQGNNIDNLPDC